MIKPTPTILQSNGLRLEPVSTDHHDELIAAASDGYLWKLWFTMVPEPDQMRAYISAAEAESREGLRVMWAVRELASGSIVGCTGFHDIVSEIDRVEVGYTWYSKSRQRTHVNKTCKLLLFEHAFEFLGCKVVALRTDSFNVASQRAIESLGAKKDGVLRHYQARRDGTPRDSVMYSILVNEWPDVKRHLQERLKRFTSEIAR